MKRIDSINARPDANGPGKVGFSDNADLPQQDATYLSPEWLNHVQEELCNLLELNGIPLNPNSKRQLYDFLVTQADIDFLAHSIEQNFIRNNRVVNNLTSGGVSNVLSAEMGKWLNENKLSPTGSSAGLSEATTVARGTARIATGVEVDTGTNNVTIVTPKSLSDFLNVFGLGFNTIIENLSLNFFSNVDYWNTSRKPWDVYVFIIGGSSTVDNMAWVNGVVVGRAPTSSGNGCFFFFRVPPGGVFKVLAKTSVGTIVIYK